MYLTVLAGSANLPLAQSVASCLGAPLGDRTLERFPDGELHVELRESVRGHDVYLIQPTGPPVETHMLELLLLADAARRAGATRLTAVLPYYGYARQDRRDGGRGAVGARVVADLLAAARIDRVVAVDLHTPALEGFLAMPLDHLSAVPLLARAAQPYLRPNSVILAPDLGAAKLAERYARVLERPVAIVHKTRLSGEAVRASGLSGEVQGKVPLIVDDLISTGGTIEAAAQTALARGCIPEITVVATHGLLVGPVALRLRALPIQRLILSDSLPALTDFPLPIESVGLGLLLAKAIGHLHRDESLRDVLVAA
jgi:ribose-phosphate pyrophosphokinase